MTLILSNEAFMFCIDFENGKKILKTFPEIYSYLSGNFRKFFNYLCQSHVSKSSIAKWWCKISMFLTNNSSDLYASCSEKNNLLLERLPGISAISNENYIPYNFQAIANISGKFTTLSQLRLWRRGSTNLQLGKF